MATDLNDTSQAFIALQQENQSLKNKVVELEAEIRRLHALAGNAELPSILSRPEFIREVARMMAHDQRYGATSTMLSLSFGGLDDSMKTLGAYDFDKVVTSLADTLAHSVRSCDIVGRTGIEDFGIFLTRCKESDAHIKAGLLIAKLKERLEPLLKGKVALSLRHAVRTLQDKADLEKIRR
ncbi:MAG: GGDEF domain-containing protein [Proteobacteria bacterium]|nr:GGDEF domain-containing protein [Pseudomonadota bacterium]